MSIKRVVTLKVCSVSKKLGKKRKAMLHITAMMEGQYFVAERKERNWETRTVDCLTGEEAFIEMSDQQLGAVLALAVAGDFDGSGSGGENLDEELYDIAEQVQDFKKELRLIP